MINQYYFTLFIMLCFLSSSNAQDEFEKWLNQERNEFENVSKDEMKALAAITKEFDKYKEEQDKLFKNFKDEVEKKWDSFRFSSKKVYVDYDEDLSSSGTIDFENGDVEIEVLVEQKDELSKKDMDEVA